MPQTPPDYLTTERVSQLTWFLMLGWKPTTSEVAKRYGMTWWGAYRMLNRLKLPLYQDDEKRWCLDRAELVQWLREALEAEDTT